MLPPIFTWLRADAAVAAITDRITRHGTAPQDTSRPYITWQLISGVPENTLSELPDIDRCTVQVDAWSASDAGVETLAKAVRDALEPHGHMTAVVVNERDLDATKLYRIGMQFDIWLDR